VGLVAVALLMPIGSAAPAATVSARAMADTVSSLPACQREVSIDTVGWRPFTSYAAGASLSLPGRYVFKQFDSERTGPMIWLDWWYDNAPAQTVSLFRRPRALGKSKDGPRPRPCLLMTSAGPAQMDLYESVSRPRGYPPQTAYMVEVRWPLRSGEELSFLGSSPDEAARQEQIEIARHLVERGVRTSP
jgi:hypothetical protein